MRQKIIRIFPILVCLTLLISCSKDTQSQSSIIATVAEDETSSYSDIEEGAITEKSMAANSEFNTKDVTISSDLVTYSTDDYYTAWENASPNYISLNGSTATLTGSGATILNGIITIYSPGVYVFSGEINEGQIIVDLLKQGNVQIVLNGASIHNSASSPIYIKDGYKTIISLPEGTNNQITDGKDYSQSDEDNLVDAAIYCNSDLTINGTGSLTLQANYKNGIVCNETLKITNGTLDITSKEDGIIGKNMIAAIGGTVLIHAGGNGMISNPSKEEKKKNLQGTVVLDGGSFIITSDLSGIKAENTLLITGGEYSIITGGTSAKEVSNEEDTLTIEDASSKESTINTTEKTSESETTTLDSTGCLALSITINGGIFTIDSLGDALYAKDSLTINGGNLTISSGDAALHADAAVYITNGTLTITKSYTGMESGNITVLDGTILITSENDGLAINKNSNSTSKSLKKEDEKNQFTINGGYLYINAAGYGLNSCGSLLMTEGTLIISGPTDGIHTSLEFKDTFKITGGVFIAFDTSDKVILPSTGSSQYNIAYTFQSLQWANILFHIEDSEGYEIMTFSPDQKYKNIIISTPDIQKGKSYSIYKKGSSNGESTNGYYTSGTYKKGIKLLDFTVTNKVTRIKQ